MECPFCQSQTAANAKYCDVCGEAIPPGQHLLEESGVVEPEEQVSPVLTTPTPAIHASRHYRFASLGDRFVAFVLDTALLFGLFAVVDAWAFLRWSTVQGFELQLTTASLLVAFGLNSVLLFLYGWLSEAACGATLGKAMVGIRVVGTSHRGPLAACAIRNVLRIVDGLGFYLLGTVVASCSGIRQRIGDIYAHTAVIEESFGRAVRITAVVLWVAIVGAASWAVPRICSQNPALPMPYLNQTIVRVGKTANSAYFRVENVAIDVHFTPSGQ